MPPRPSRNDVAFTLGDLVRIVRRRAPWFAIPASAGVVIALGVALGLPPIYEAATKILIEAQGIPDRLVPSSVSADKETRFHNISFLILSRDNLAKIITEYDLYADLEAPMEERVSAMREDITIEPILPKIVDPRRPIELNSVRIAYRGGDPTLISDVANQLARDFIRENLESRAADAEGTSEFLDAELGRETQELNRVAREIIGYKEKHLGELPEQLAENRAKLERLNQELAMKQGELETARNQTGAIRAQLHEMRMASEAGADNPTIRHQRLIAQLTAMQAQGYTERHPDVISTRAEIAQLATTIAAAQNDGGARTQPYTPEEARLYEELRNYEVSLQVVSDEVERLGEEIAKYEARIEGTPQHAAELQYMQSRYDNLGKSIAEVQAKKTEADIARAMEVKQKGEKFRVIESAVPPHFPIEPNRPLVFVIGVVLGTVAGIAFMVIRELTDRRLYTLAELQAQLPQLAVLGAIPVIRLAGEIAEARARLRRIAFSAVAAVLVLSLAGAGVWFLFSGPDSGPTAQTGTEGDV